MYNETLRRTPRTNILSECWESRKSRRCKRKGEVHWQLAGVLRKRGIPGSVARPHFVCDVRCQSRMIRIASARPRSPENARFGTMNALPLVRAIAMTSSSASTDATLLHGTAPETLPIAVDIPHSSSVRTRSSALNRICGHSTRKIIAAQGIASAAAISLHFREPDCDRVHKPKDATRVNNSTWYRYNPLGWSQARQYHPKPLLVSNDSEW